MTDKMLLKTLNMIFFQGIFPRNVHQLGKNLVITSADHSDSGIYLCHVNSSSQVTYKLLEIIVGKYL